MEHNGAPAVRAYALTLSCEYSVTVTVCWLKAKAPPMRQHGRWTPLKGGSTYETLDKGSSVCVGANRN